MKKQPKWKVRIQENIRAAEVSRLDAVARARWRAAKALQSIPVLTK